MKVTCSIDWATAVKRLIEPEQWYPVPDLYRQLDIVMSIMDMLGDDEENWRYTGYQRFYSAVWRHSSGVEFALPRAGETGFRAVATGSTCKNLDIQKLILDLFARHFYLTRLDVAVDVFDSDIEIAQLFADISGKTRAGKTRVYSYVCNANSGDTLYLGSRQSDVFVRIYDKGKEQQSSLNWKRFELELKGDVARSLTNKDILLYPALSKMLWDRLNSSDKEVKEVENQVMSIASSADSVRVARNKTDRERWLYTQVAPALAKMLCEDAEAFDAFFEHIRNLQKRFQRRD